MYNLYHIYFLLKLLALLLWMKINILRQHKTLASLIKIKRRPVERQKERGPMTEQVSSSRSFEPDEQEIRKKLSSVRKSGICDPLLWVSEHRLCLICVSALGQTADSTSVPPQGTHLFTSLPLEELRLLINKIFVRVSVKSESLLIHHQLSQRDG
jgi:hypothetical protein